MIIKSIELADYRNYDSLVLQFDRGTNILYGDNAQGKTNILEAIYVAATTKSHKGSKDREIVNFDKEEAHIRTYLEKDGKEIRVDMHLRKSKSKGIAIDGQKIKKAADLLGLCNVVFFSPEDLGIIKNGPSERRRFVDMELCQLDNFYLYNLNHYNKIVNQRNKLLKDMYMNPDLKETLTIWDMQLMHSTLPRSLSAVSIRSVRADRSSIGAALTEMQAAGIENILALRGDIPKDFDGEVFTDFTHASDLVRFIKENGDFCVGGACYPEMHPDSANKNAEIQGLKEKVDAGCEYLTTQMFFDNNIFFNFMYRVREAGITVPIIPGIMPITRGVQVKNAVKLSGCNVPERFKNIVDRFGDNPEAMKQAGIAYATDQIIDLLANGVKHIHVYSMNKPDVAAGIQRNLSEILKA